MRVGLLQARANSAALSRPSAREACSRGYVQCRMETQTVVLGLYAFGASVGLAAIVVLVGKVRGGAKVGRPAHAKASSGKSVGMH
jgi:hypothetical protein